MRKIISLLLVVPIYSTFLYAGITFSSLQSYTVSGKYIGATLPFTVGAWVNPVSFTGTNRIITSGNSGSGGWSLQFCGSTCGCGANGDIEFAKLHVVDVCSTIAISTGVWTFVGVTVSSSTVHFFTMTASGTVTTSNVSNSSTIGTPTSPITEVSDNSSSAMSGTIAQAMVWLGVSLSDTELKAAAYGGPYVIGRVVTLYYPLYNINSTNGLGNMAAGNPTYILGQAGTPSNGNHCPCSNPFVGR